MKNLDLRKRFGITLDDYVRLLIEQQGVCAICGAEEKRRGNHGRVKDLAVDHDHATGAIRGLLCADCNTAIGLLGDNPRLIRAALVYVERRNG